MKDKLRCHKAFGIFWGLSTSKLPTAVFWACNGSSRILCAQTVLGCRFAEYKVGRLALHCGANSFTDQSIRAAFAGVAMAVASLRFWPGGICSPPRQPQPPQPPQPPIESPGMVRPGGPGGTPGAPGMPGIAPGILGGTTPGAWGAPGRPGRGKPSAAGSRAPSNISSRTLRPSWSYLHIRMAPAGGIGATPGISISPPPSLVVCFMTNHW